MTNNINNRNPVEVLADEFLERYRLGERPSVSEYTTRYPDLAHKIEDLFPALILMEDAAPGESMPTPGDILDTGPT